MPKLVLCSTNLLTALIRPVDGTNLQAKGRVSTDRSVETALPSTTPCQVRKSSTDNSEFRHRTEYTRGRPYGADEAWRVIAPFIDCSLRQSGARATAGAYTARLIKSHCFEPFDSRNSYSHRCQLWLERIRP